MKEVWNKLIILTVAHAQTEIGNPLGKNTTLFTVIVRVVDGLIILAIPIVVFMVIYAGFLFVTAQGNVEKLEKAKRAILYSLIGALILVGAWAIADLIRSTIESLR